MAAPIATCTGWLSYGVENYEPITWAEELIEPARAVDHPRLAALYVMASQCYNTGRINEAIGYSEAGQMAMHGSGSGEVYYGFESLLCAAYVFIGQPERAVEWCRASSHRTRDTHTLNGAYLVIALRSPAALRRRGLPRPV